MFEQLHYFMQSTINQPVSLRNLSDMCATVQLCEESCSDAIIFSKHFTM